MSTIIWIVIILIALLFSGIAIFRRIRKQEKIGSPSPPHSDEEPEAPNDAAPAPPDERGGTIDF